DGGRVGGVGWAFAAELREQGVPTEVLTFALPQEFLDHGSREDVLEAAGLTAQAISLRIVESVAHATRIDEHA
ncbi:1-deoxy-D-xylulose-5-phosphate synthase, partial [Kineococcus sp. R8]